MDAVREGKSKYRVEIKQSENGEYYLESLQVDADSVEELESLIDQALPVVKRKIESLNDYSMVHRQGKSKIKVDSKSLDANDTELYEHLKQLRVKLAKDEALPAYMIFTNIVLSGMARTRPKTRDHLLKIHGVGETKYEKYGELFIEAINEFEKMKEQ